MNVPSDHENYKRKFSSNDLDVILLQFTGLTDRNGKEIYEGDIIEVSKENIEHIGGSITKTVVGYKNGCYMAGRNNIDNLNTYLWLLAGDVGNCEVIGNIYENPELLETKEAC